MGLNRQNTWIAVKNKLFRGYFRDETVSKKYGFCQRKYKINARKFTGFFVDHPFNGNTAEIEFHVKLKHKLTSNLNLGITQ